MSDKEEVLTSVNEIVRRNVALEAENAELKKWNANLKTENFKLAVESKTILEHCKDLERIIAESQIQNPALWCVWDKRNQRVFWSHPRLNGGEEACKDYIAAATIPEWLEVRKLVASPVIQEGMQFVGEKSKNGIEWQFANTVHDMAIGTKLYAMLNASKPHESNTDNPVDFPKEVL